MVFMTKQSANKRNELFRIYLFDLKIFILKRGILVLSCLSVIGLSIFGYYYYKSYKEIQRLETELRDMQFIHNAEKNKLQNDFNEDKEK